MRRYNVTEAPRPILTHELGELIRREEHLNPDRPDRAAAYARALQELEMGAPAATARHTEFRINDDLTTRYGVTEGTRAEILAELEEYGKSRADSELKAARYARALMYVQVGNDEVKVRDIVYRVVED